MKKYYLLLSLVLGFAFLLPTNGSALTTPSEHCIGGCKAGQGAPKKKRSASSAFHGGSKPVATQGTHLKQPPEKATTGARTHQPDTISGRAKTTKQTTHSNEPAPKEETIRR